MDSALHYAPRTEARRPTEKRLSSGLLIKDESSNTSMCILNDFYIVSRAPYQLASRVSEAVLGFCSDLHLSLLRTGSETLNPNPGSARYSSAQIARTQ